MDTLFIVIPVIAVLSVIVISIFRKHFSSEEEQTSHITPPYYTAPLQIKSVALRTPDFSMLPRQFIVLDLETTGLNPLIDEIIEFGAIKANLDSTDHATFQSLVKPEKKIPRLITQITGISQNMVDSEGDPLIDVLTDFIEFVADLPLVTFNAAFDMGFLHNAARRHGLSINNRYTCALTLARRAWPGLPSYRLVDLAKMGNLSANNTHRALGDCERALHIFTAAASVHGKKIRWSQRPS